MNRFGDLLRLSFLSLEFCGVVAALAYWQLEIVVLRDLGTKFQSDSDAVKFVYMAPAAILAYSLSIAKKTLRPSDASGAILAEWPHLFMLENRVYFSVIINFSATVLSVVLWLNGKNMGPNILALCVLLAFFLVIVSTGSLLLAEHRVQRILDSAKS